MVPAFEKAPVSNEDSSLSDSMSVGGNEKTIPFLRRLRDMLRENEGVISFVPGHRRNGQVVLGRLVVHDRIEVEATVLPKYFNHSSFASLRRQLNYFSFVRLGKGRQRESTYINDGVVALDDILALRRRSVGAGGQPPTHTITQHQGEEEEDLQVESTKAKRDVSAIPTKTYVESIVPVVHLPKTTAPPKSTFLAAKRAKRVKQGKPKKLQLPRMSTPFVSEDEESQGNKQQHIALDLTKPPSDPEILQGCTALLGLSGKLW